MQYLFTAVFTKNEKGLLDVNFPDLPNCRTQGNNMVDAAKKAEAVLSLCLFDMEQHGIPIPSSRMPDEVKTNPGEIASMVKGDTDACHARFAGNTELHTIEIPMWLAQMAKTSNLNISELLQNSIREEVGVPTQAIIAKSPPPTFHQPTTTFTAANTPAPPPQPQLQPAAVTEPEIPRTKKKKFGFIIPVAVLVVLLITAGSYILWNSDLAQRLRDTVADTESIATTNNSNYGNPNNSVSEPGFVAPPTPQPSTPQDLDYQTAQEDYDEEHPYDSLPETVWDDVEEDEPGEYDLAFAHVGIVGTNVHMPIVNAVGASSADIANFSNEVSLMTAGAFDANGPTSNLVIVGNNPGDGRQFGDLPHFTEITNLHDFFIIIDTGVTLHFWEIFSFYIDAVNFDFEAHTSPAFNQTFAGLSMNPTGVVVTEDDRIITLITNRTSDGSERYVMHARLTGI